jgi:hypothetical protein
MRQRDVRSANQPNSGEANMYETRNAVDSSPMRASLMGEPAAANSAPIFTSTAASTCRST